ncbi:hypothetical protein PROFUN_14838 [Planoprotostelium fungivorum]|uniref:Thiol-disulfide oxidoreductase DCC n=1 Tax=Planoprotostelium fungivorum TaxID=1890364 RepID=A0A2P6MYM6_9EUKA|nr:hypothetical protein PROFUN_14838 [Planoprotostelium fungivorum]
MSSGRKVVLFDGVCNLCDGVVRFIHAFDGNNVMTFCPLQSRRGLEYVQKYNLPTDLSTVCFVDEEEGRAWTQSTAVLRILSYLNFPVNFLYGLILLPPFIRDLGYQGVAAIRYNVFGKSKTQACQFMPGLRSKFLDTSNEADED